MKKNYHHLFWLDLEMSGLDIEVDRIIEIATVVTDLQLNVVAEGPSLAISQEQVILDGMDEWNQKHHGASGLIEKVKASSITEAAAEIMTLRFLEKYTSEKGTVPLCGNSVHQDRKFLAKYMPKLHDFFHYRNIDVSTLKELCRCWYPETPLFTKKNKHTALEDTLESIEEMGYYRQRLFNS